MVILAITGTICFYTGLYSKIWWVAASNVIIAIIDLLLAYKSYKAMINIANDIDEFNTSATEAINDLEYQVQVIPCVDHSGDDSNDDEDNDEDIQDFIDKCNRQ